ncbi:hypothetical protein MTO96_023299 [Rhipicephalus appendiculatus]
MPPSAAEMGKPEYPFFSQERPRMATSSLSCGKTDRCTSTAAGPHFFLSLLVQLQLGAPEIDGARIGLGPLDNGATTTHAPLLHPVPARGSAGAMATGSRSTQTVAQAPAR